MIFPVKYKHPKIDSVPSRQDVTTSSCNVMDLERMPEPETLWSLCQIKGSFIAQIAQTMKILCKNQSKYTALWILHAPLSAIWNRGCLMTLWGPSLLYKELRFVIAFASWIKFVLLFLSLSPSFSHFPCVFLFPIPFVLLRQLQPSPMHRQLLHFYGCWDKSAKKRKKEQNKKANNTRMIIRS